MWVCARACLHHFTMQITDGFHIISKMKPVMWPHLAEVSDPGCTSWTFTHTGGWGVGGGAGVREGRPEGQRGLVPQAFVHSSS